MISVWRHRSLSHFMTTGKVTVQRNLTCGSRNMTPEKRRARRLMEAENKKLWDTARKERNEEIRVILHVLKMKHTRNDSQFTEEFGCWQMMVSFVKGFDRKCFVSWSGPYSGQSLWEITRMNNMQIVCLSFCLPSK